MKKYFVLILLGLLLSNIAVAAEALEDAYREQFKKYASEIQDLRNRIAADESSFNEISTMYEQKCIPYRPYLDNVCRDILANAKIPADRLATNRDRLKNLEENKLALKIRILEVRGELPAWWDN